MKYALAILAGAFIGYWMPLFFSLGATVIKHCGSW